MKALMVGLMAAALASPAAAQKKYDAGASDKEIKIGNTNPYSGPASAYGQIGRAIAAYFKMVNDQGGINGRKVTFVTYDDSYSPPKTVEMARKLVEQELPDRGAHLREAHPLDQAQRQDRHPLPERRLR